MKPGLVTPLSDVFRFVVRTTRLVNPKRPVSVGTLSRMRSIRNKVARYFRRGTLPSTAATPRSDRLRESLSLLC